MKPSSTSTSSLLTTSSRMLLSVEWNSNVAEIRHRLVPSATHFVLPDLPGVVSDRERVDFSSRTDPTQRIHTIATCRHESAESLLKSASCDVDPGSKLLLVSGNDRGPNAISSIDAAGILKNEVGNDLYGVANPNDPLSVETIGAKLEAGMSGFVTQPLFSSRAVDTLRAYRERADDATILAGMAFPKTARGLRFWAKLLDQEDELEADDKFRSHVEYFSRPNAASFAWIERELHDLLALSESKDDGGCIDGIHFMPLKNTDDLCGIFRSMNHAN
eukprot:CAMPEP_0197186644 /NCGR_PEP_ID=MMETSP1423-20130617/14319_1 /TAXON_ID=476441 /ORGANISM="Pseudo-nitzschia heimii, Strain UNC1101" /LENGTH=274 /DNA_ID=CAMNT_0042638015 /DNA_START=164 /DNA_END=988 /DNA_ORIENTATION=+